MDYTILLAYAVGLLLLYLAARLLYLPIKVIALLIYNSLLGGVMLWLLNLVGAYVGFHIPINLVSAPLAGFLGLPGIVLLVILQYFWL